MPPLVWLPGLRVRTCKIMLISGPLIITAASNSGRIHPERDGGMVPICRGYNRTSCGNSVVALELALNCLTRAGLVKCRADIRFESLSKLSGGAQNRNPGTNFPRMALPRLVWRSLLVSTSWLNTAYMSLPIFGMMCNRM